MVSRLGEGHMPGTFFLSEQQLKTTVPNTHCMPFVANILLHFWALLCENGLFFFCWKRKSMLLTFRTLLQRWKRRCFLWVHLCGKTSVALWREFCPKIMKYFLIHNCWDMIQYARIPYSCHYNVLHSFNPFYCIVRTVL